MNMWNIIKQSLRFAVIFFFEQKGNLLQYFQAGVFHALRFQPQVGSNLVTVFFPKLCVHCIANSALLCVVLGLDLLGFIVKRTWQVCAPCEEGNNVSHLHTKRVPVQVKSWGFAKFEIFFSVRNTGTILFSVPSEHHAHFTPGYPRWFARDKFHWFFRLNLCQVLLLFRAVQVKQLAFLASFLSDLFRRLATLSCRVLIVTWLCSESRWATWEGWKQPMISFRPNTCWFPRESSMIFFPLLCLMIGGYFHSDFSVRTLWLFSAA